MVIAFVVFVTMCYVSSDLDMTQKDVLCDPESYDVHDYADSVAYVPEEMATVTANRPDYSYSTQTTYPSEIVFERSKCDGMFMVSDCVICLSFAKSFIEKKFVGRVGGQVHLKDCYMVYKHYPI